VFSLWFVVDVDYALDTLHRVVMYSAADVSEIRAVSTFGV
jgi:hypothetical protein